MTATLSDIAARLGQSISDPKAGERIISQLLTDSRSLETPSSTLFFAIPSAGNDGHRYIADLYRKGVRSFVVNHIPPEMEGSDAVFLLVDNTVAALQSIAARGDRFSSPILAITGSRGKTSLK